MRGPMFSGESMLDDPEIFPLSPGPPDGSAVWLHGTKRSEASVIVAPSVSSDGTMIDLDDLLNQGWDVYGWSHRVQ